MEFDFRTPPPREPEMNMPDENLTIDGVRVPRFLYGTAWKEDATKSLTESALREGFRGIDTANQRKHYFEAAVGEAVKATIASGLVTRSDLFLQTKFTFAGGQDHRLPYDPNAPIAKQVEQSFASSLAHFGTDTIDSYVLHGPTTRGKLTATDWEAWRAMEALHAGGKTRLLGVSNVNIGQLRELCATATVGPRFVQNRCYASQGWDHEVRAFCTTNGIAYQGFSLLTANRHELARPEVTRIAARHKRTVAQVTFRFALDVGMIVLTGTTKPEHMRDDLTVFGFQLDPAEVAEIEHIGGEAPRLHLPK
jgi:diketogulonate reductase-like aldo/keto reductase